MPSRRCHFRHRDRSDTQFRHDLLSVVEGLLHDRVPTYGDPADPGRLARYRSHSYIM